MRRRVIAPPAGAVALKGAAPTVLVAYTHADVLRRTGATTRQLAHWTVSGVVTPGVRRAAGSGDRRLYDTENVIAVRVAVLLADLHMTLPVIRLAVGAPLRSALAEGDRYLLIYGADTALITHCKPGELESKLWGPTGRTLVIDLDTVKRDCQF